MLFMKEEKKSAEEFWREYEENTGEKVLTRGMGKYVSGWKVFDDMKQRDISGLVITTSGGFRFHYFPQKHWFDSLTRSSEKEKKDEKSIFIPQERITSCDLVKEKKWWKRVFSSAVPHLVVNYRDSDSPESGENEGQLIFEATFYSQVG